MKRRKAISKITQATAAAYLLPITAKSQPPIIDLLGCLYEEFGPIPGGDGYVIYASHFIDWISRMLPKWSTRQWRWEKDMAERALCGELNDYLKSGSSELFCFDTIMTHQRAKEIVEMLLFLCNKHAMRIGWVEVDNIYWQGQYINNDCRNKAQFYFEPI